MIKNSIFFLLIIFFISCGKNSSSSGVLKPKEMQAVLWDILRADAFTNTFQKMDSTKNLAEENVKLQKEIFLIHNTSKEQFYKSYDYYKAHTDMMKALLDSVISKANRERQDVRSPVKPLRSIVKDTTTTTTK